MSDSAVPRRRYRWVRLGSSVLLFPTQPGAGGGFYLLNETAAFAYQHRHLTIPEVAQRLVEVFDVPLARARDDLRRFGIGLEQILSDFRVVD